MGDYYTSPRSERERLHHPLRKSPSSDLEAVDRHTGNDLRTFGSDKPIPHSFLVHWVWCDVSEGILGRTKLVGPGERLTRRQERGEDVGYPCAIGAVQEG